MKAKWFCLLLILWGLVSFPVQGQDVAADLFGRINALRAQVGLPPYALNGVLTAAAQNQANWMVSTGQFAHTHPDGNSVRDRTAAAGYGSTWVTENTYLGTIATVEDAWSFWMGSSVHYGCITSTYYYDIGIATASGDYGTGFVLVFGNPGGIAVISPASAEGNSSGDGGNTSNSAPEQPPYVVGLDQYGNIMHEIQPGDDLGNIALIYGYTWADLPYIRQLNGLTETDDRLLTVGEILLIPPKDGTYTPTPPDTPSPAATATLPAPVNTPISPSPVATTGVILPTITNPPGLMVTPTLPPSTPTPIVAVATVDSYAPPDGLIPPSTLEVVVVEKNRTPPLLLAAIGVQALLLAAAGIEFWRRNRS